MNLTHKKKKNKYNYYDSSKNSRVLKTNALMLH